MVSASAPRKPRTYTAGGVLKPAAGERERGTNSIACVVVVKVGGGRVVGRGCGKVEAN